MKDLKKGNEVIKILDFKRHDLEGYVIFEDNWLGEQDKTLKDSEGNVFNVLGFATIEENELKHPELMPYLDGWVLRKRNCFKLDKEVSIGKILFKD